MSSHYSLYLSLTALLWHTLPLSLTLSLSCLNALLPHALPFSPSQTTSKRRRHEALTILDRQRLKRISMLSRLSLFLTTLTEPEHITTFIRVVSTSEDQVRVGWARSEIMKWNIMLMGIGWSMTTNLFALHPEEADMICLVAWCILYVCGRYIWCYIACAWGELRVR
jgi:hypothetical protein